MLHGGGKAKKIDYWATESKMVKKKNNILLKVILVYCVGGGDCDCCLL